MKVVIAGSRNIPEDQNSFKLLLEVIKLSGYDITDVVCGKARGADSLGEKYARVKNLGLIEMPADWNKHGKAAGSIRNAAMAKVADAAIVLWDGKSPGSRNMIEQMSKQHKPCYIHFVLED